MAQQHLRAFPGIVVALLTVCVGVQAAQAAATAEPRLTVPRQKLAAALRCQPEVRDAKRTPVMLVTATGIPGRRAWAAGPDFQAVLLRAGYPSCYVDFPSSTTGDIQVAAQYLVHGVLRQRQLAGRKVAVYATSVGGLLSRWALTYWPRLRGEVTDVVSVGGPHQGTTWASVARVVDGLCRPGAGCPPSFWQQSVGSRLLRALNARRDATPGPTHWTTVRTVHDELVAPQTHPYPTSSLAGASNISVQAVCPERTTGHVAAFYDSVSFAALLDALAHHGTAKPARFPSDVCAHPHARGADPAATDALIEASFGEVTARVLAAPRAKAEPRLHGYARVRLARSEQPRGTR